MNDIPRLSEKELLILKLLINTSGELYGLQMIEMSGGKLKMGTLYTTLNRMENKGYIKSKKEVARLGARGLPRRLYKPTGEGVRAYEAWSVANGMWVGEFAHE